MLGMRGFVPMMVVALAGCQMANPAFDTGSNADEVGASESLGHTSESLGESGTSGIEGTTDPESTSASESTSSSDAESSSTETTLAESSETLADTGPVMACTDLVAADPCPACALESCCVEATLGCFDPNDPGGCSCVLACLLEGLNADMCGANCRAPLEVPKAAEVLACIVEACGADCV